MACAWKKYLSIFFALIIGLPLSHKPFMALCPGSSSPLSRTPSCNSPTPPLLAWDMKFAKDRTKMALVEPG